MNQQTTGRVLATRAVVAAVFSVLVIFLVILLIGSPIATLGSKGESAAYAIAIFIPPAAICLLALARSSKAP